MACPYNEILFDGKQKWSTDTCYNVDEPWKHYAKWKKAFTKDHTFYDNICVKCPEQGNL